MSKFRKQTTLNKELTDTHADKQKNCKAQFRTSNLTFRKKPSYRETPQSSDEDDLLSLGNTLKSTNSISPEKINMINIQQFDALLKRNLKEYNKSFLSQIITIIQTEIETSL